MFTDVCLAPAPAADGGPRVGGERGVPAIGLGIGVRVTVNFGQARGELCDVRLTRWRALHAHRRRFDSCP